MPLIKSHSSRTNCNVISGFQCITIQYCTCFTQVLRKGPSCCANYYCEGISMKMARVEQELWPFKARTLVQKSAFAHSLSAPELDRDLLSLSSSPLTTRPLSGKDPIPLRRWRAGELAQAAQSGAGGHSSSIIFCSLQSYSPLLHKQIGRNGRKEGKGTKRQN